MHFIGADKPWHWDRFFDGAMMPRGAAEGENMKNLQELVSKWWSVHDVHVSGWSKDKGAYSKAASMAMYHNYLQRPDSLSGKVHPGGASWDSLHERYASAWSDLGEGQADRAISTSL